MFNDIPYLLNKDVLLDYILRPLADRKDASDWSELYKPWWTDEYYNKANVLMYYEPAEERPEEEALAADYFNDAVETICSRIFCLILKLIRKRSFIFSIRLTAFYSGMM